eukprot:CAMPEP_0170548352 /NCGR_PEP_ID=MMETSP0211-20121228/6672_1 /TAXON_ID=311385 /ORGANISM="Pseudokeronopsis sp., Strain OXSARD2" /LENGTH=117 /DNA_ID=CAMNT_0010853855 /DNA_START=419 /DNA_END=772 /DNA_ORIENTATION=+
MKLMNRLRNEKATIKFEDYERDYIKKQTIKQLRTQFNSPKSSLEHDKFLNPKAQLSPMGGQQLNKSSMNSFMINHSKDGTYPDFSLENMGPMDVNHSTIRDNEVKLVNKTKIKPIYS